jgi:hypothetical protein
MKFECVSCETELTGRASSDSEPLITTRPGFERIVVCFVSAKGRMDDSRKHGVEF